jgi:Zn finger protein HypA/HybF involved in hydrogenase expression
MTLTYIKNEEGQFVCPDCHVVKTRQNSMHYHMKKHLEELNHVCKACKKGFLQKQTLDLHIRSKHPELQEENGETKKYACPSDGCDFRALTKGNCIIHCLRVHYQNEIKDRMIVNEETKQIMCKDCQHTFQSSCSFYYHCKKCLDKTHQGKFSLLSMV